MSRYSDVITGDNPITYWRLNEESGTDCVPLVGPTTGTYVNCTLGEPSLIAGNEGKSVYFNGTSSVVQFADACGLSGTTEKTYTFWFKPDAASTYGVFDSCPYDGRPTWQFGPCRHYPGDSLQWLAAGSGAPTLTYDFQAGQRYHVAFVTSHGSEGRHAYLYVNGELVDDEGTGIDYYNIVGTFRLGNINNGDNGWFKGWLQEFAAFHAVLTAQQIAEHYATGWSIQVNAVKGLPLGLLQTTRGETKIWRSTLKMLRAFQTAQFDYRVRVRRVEDLPVSARGYVLALWEQWNVRHPYVTRFADFWEVVRPVIGSLEESWAVQEAIAGGSIRDSWRVLKPTLAALYADDVQLPYGEINS